MKRRAVRKKKNSQFTLTLILLAVLALCVLGYSGYKLLKIADTYREEGEYYSGVDSIFTGDTHKMVDPDFNWDYDKLLELCEDGVGYIYQKSVMSYPIVQAQDNDKYLRHMMNGEYNVAGTIFVDARMPEGMEGKYSIVYGHNMDDGSMFGTLPRYEQLEYYKEHPYFDIYIGYKHYRYYVFSAFVTETDGYVYTYEINDGDYKAQFDRLRADGNYETDVRELREDDHVIVLSTCVDWHDYSYRNIVCLVRGEEINDEGL